MCADTIALTPSKDNTLYEYVELLGDQSNGAGDHIFAGATAHAEPQARRALIAFDVAGGLPAGATITSVRLKLNCSMTISDDQSIALHRMASDWGEGPSDAIGQEGGGTDAQPGDATWRHTFFPGPLWTSPGGDFVGSPSATALVGLAAAYVWGSTPEMVADVQAWLNTPSTNYGWILIGNESVLATAKRFDSRTNPIEGNRPLLIVEFTPPPRCGSADFDGDGDTGTDADIEAFFACLGGNCCPTCGSADFDGDGDTGTDADIEAFFRVLGGGMC